MIELKGPKFIVFFNQILLVLRELGGTGNKSEVIDSIVEKLDIPDIELEEKLKSGASKIKNQIAWARIYLVKSALMKDDSERGIWSLTELGFNTNLSEEESYNLFKRIHSLFRKGNKNKIVKEDSVVSEVKYTDEFLTLLRSTSPSGFERICQRLLRESGFKNVLVTGKTCDGGIDGEGILEINPLISFKVLFQAKRYCGSVGSSVIRDFRGAMQGRADKGIIITTGYFTKEAKKEAIRDGTNPIELVDGESLIKLFENKKIGVIPKTIYEIDYSFFDEYIK